MKTGSEALALSSIAPEPGLNHRSSLTFLGWLLPSSGDEGDRIADKNLLRRVGAITSFQLSFNALPGLAYKVQVKSTQTFIIGRGVRHHSGTALNKANAIMGYGVRSNQPGVCAICLNNLFYHLYRASASRWISTLDSSVTVWRRRIRMRFRMVLLIKCCLGSQAAASFTLSSSNKPEQCVVCKKRERE